LTCFLEGRAGALPRLPAMASAAFLRPAALSRASRPTAAARTTRDVVASAKRTEKVLKKAKKARKALEDLCEATACAPVSGERLASLREVEAEAMSLTARLRQLVTEMSEMDDDSSSSSSSESEDEGDCMVAASVAVAERAVLPERGRASSASDLCCAIPEDERATTGNSTAAQCGCSTPVVESPHSRAVVMVCQGKSCMRHGAAATLEAAKGVAADAGVDVRTCKCLGHCKEGPAVRVVGGDRGTQTFLRTDAKLVRQVLDFHVGVKDRTPVMN